MTTSVDDRAVRFRNLALPLLGYLNRLAFALTGNRQSAEDLVQESVLRGLRYFDSYQGGDFRAWLAAIMRNLNRDQARRASVALDEDWAAEIPDPAQDPEQVVVADDQAARLHALIKTLPDALREVLVMREFGDLSYSQIAAALELPIGTVMSRLSRARDNLRAAWLTSSGGWAS